MRTHVKVLGWLYIALGALGTLGALAAFAVLNLPNAPMGTVIGIYTFWVLLHDDTRALFEAG